jgi:hypothetical protein
VALLKVPFTPVSSSIAASRRGPNVFIRSRKDNGGFHETLADLSGTRIRTT